MAMHCARVLSTALFGAFICVKPVSAAMGDWIGQAMQASPNLSLIHISEPTRPY